MALNVQVFKTRAITAIVFAVVMMAGLLISKWGFVALFVIIHFGCWWEYFKLVEKIHDYKTDPVIKYLFILIGFIVLWYAAFPNYSFDVYKAFGDLRVSFKYLLLAFIALLLIIVFLVQNKAVPGRAKWLLLAGFFYISMPVFMLINLRMMESGDDSVADSGLILPFGIIFSIWINDTMAYIVGSLIGKTPFSKISPKKTWEGTGGGALLCIIVIACIGYFSNFYTLKDWAIIAAVCAVFGTAGDLLESKLKRLAGVKDSGSFMPGHGGFLDRFDSLLVAVPFVWVYVYFFL
jgi:phosphatidate cytidylyltransferase